MKNILIITLLIFLSFSSQAFTEEDSAELGSSQWEQSMKLLNETAKSNLKDFAADLGRHYGLSEETTDLLLNKTGMEPSGAYMAAKVSKIAQRPMEDVVNEYESSKDKGWGVIAKNLGIKPGSKEFHELKSDDSGILAKSNGKKNKKEKGKNGKKNKSKGGKGKNK